MFAPIIKKLLIYLVAVVCAITAGMLLSTPLETDSLAGIGIALALFASPILLKHHHVAVVVSANMAVQIFFLPGTPTLWALMSVVSLSITLLSFTLNKRVPLQFDKGISWSLILLGLVAIGTGIIRGGVGFKVFGGQSYGGKHYYSIIIAIIFFFALSVRPLARPDVLRIGWIFFLGGLTCMIPNIIAALPAPFAVLFLVFPYEYAVHQMGEGYRAMGFARWEGVSWAGVYFCFFLLARYPMRSLIDFSRPTRTGILGIGVVATTLGGHRSHLILVMLVFGVAFIHQRLYRTHLVAVWLGIVIFFLAVTIPFASSLPLVIQRAISFLPVDLDARILSDGDATANWRFTMWGILAEQIPDHLVVGKGYFIDPVEFELSDYALKAGFIENYESSMIAGNYHSGPLSLILPLGVPGTLAYLSFWGFSIRHLSRAIKRGRTELYTLNVALYSIFVSRVLYFLFVNGGASMELATFTGLVGVSLAINGPMTGRDRSGRSDLQTRMLTTRAAKVETAVSVR